MKGMRFLLSAFALSAAACSDGTGATGPSAEASFAKGGQAGTTLSASTTAAGVWEHYYVYDWSLSKIVDQASATLAAGQSATFNYTVTATRGAPAESDKYAAGGQVCVTNGGAVATTGLAITAVVQIKSGGGPFSDHALATVDVSAKPALAAGESHCYPYRVEFTTVAGASYRSAARVTITNHSGRLGEPFGPGFNGGGVKADFSLPSTATPINIDQNASVADAVTCPAGFVCSPLASSWALTGSGTTTYAVTVTNVSAACGTSASMVNVANLTEETSGATRSATRTVALATTACPPVVINQPQISGCTRTQGYWQNEKKAWPSGFSRSAQFFGSGLTWQQVLEAPVAGDQYFSLAHQWIAATLNVATGATTPVAVTNAIGLAGAWLSANQPNPARGQSALLDGWKSTMDEYNNGRAAGGAPHCS